MNYFEDKDVIIPFYAVINVGEFENCVVVRTNEPDAQQGFHIDGTGAKRFLRDYREWLEHQEK